MFLLKRGCFRILQHNRRCILAISIVHSSTCYTFQHIHWYEAIKIDIKNLWNDLQRMVFKQRFCFLQNNVFSWSSYYQKVQELVLFLLRGDFNEWKSNCASFYKMSQDKLVFNLIVRLILQDIWFIQRYSW